MGFYSITKRIRQTSIVLLICVMLLAACVAQAQSNFIVSDFGTAGSTPIVVSAYTSSVGGAYAWTGSIGGDVMGTTATTPPRVRNAVAGSGEYYNATASTSGTYSVYGKITHLSAIAGANIGIAGRIKSPTGTAFEDVCADFDSGSNLRFYWRDAGTISGPGGALQTTTLAPTAGQFIYTRMDFTSTTVQLFYIVSSTDTALLSAPALTGWTSTGAAATLPTALQGATSYIGPVGYGAASGTTGANLNGILARYPGAGASITSVSPTSANTSSTTTLTFVGSGTHWTTSTPTATVQNTTTTATAGTVTVVDDTHATIPLTTNATAGSFTVTLTNGTDGALTSPSVTVTSPAGTNIAVNNTNWYFSPYNWYSTGGTFQSVNNITSTATYALSINPGAYCQFYAAATGTITLKVDMTALSVAGVAAAAYPKIKWSIDGLPWQTYQFAATDANKSLFSGAVGSHACTLYFMASEGGSTDRWNTPVSSLKITGLTLDSGGSLSSLSGTALAPLSKNYLWFGTSISEGAWSLATSFQTNTQANYVAYTDAQLSWTAGASLALGGNEGRCAVGGQSWLNTNGANVPPLGSAWNYYFSTNSRLSGGKLFPIPDGVFVEMGANDGGNWQATAVSTLTAIRAAVNTTTPIFLIVPFGQQGAGYASGAKAALSGDTYLYLLNLGNTGYNWLTGYSSNSTNRYSSDGLHPNYIGNASVYTPLVTQAAQAATGTTITVTKTVKPSRQLPRNSRN